MQVLHERCAGLDIHTKTVVACPIVPAPDGKPKREVRTFGTMSDDILALSDWLAANGVTHVAMESTGVYWKPVYNILEASFEVLLVNAQHIKAVPGRKSDVKDCEWIADLLRHGLLRGSFVPDKPQRELRELTRYRTTLVRERAAEVNRLQKTLEGANIKLANVASDVMGQSGRAMLAGLIEGVADAAALAELAKGKLRDKIPQLERALKGQFGPHQRFLVGQQLEHIDYLDHAIEKIGGEIARRLDPFEAIIELLDTIPGIGRRVAEILAAEIGMDMNRWPTARHIASWAHLSPECNESAGKRKSTKTGKGNPWLKSVLVEAAQAAAHTKDTYLSAQYHRLAARRGSKKAIIAVAHSILVIAYYIIKRKEPYRELGGNHFDESDRRAVERRLIKRLERLGNRVTVEPMAPAA